MLQRLVLLGILLLSHLVFAMNGRTTYQAKIVKPDGYPLEAANVHFRFSVLDTVGSCVLYVEDYAVVNMQDTRGLISFALGNGARSFPTSGTPQTFQNIFDNSVASFPCQNAGIYNPTLNDTRRIVMQFNDGSGWQTLPAMTINSVPYAMYADKANVATTLNNKADTAFVEYATLASLNCNSATHAITFNGVSFSCIPVGSGGGGGGITSVTTSGSVLTTAGTASAPVIGIQAVSLSQDGYLTALDYAEFKAKLSASSTQIINTLGYEPANSVSLTSLTNSVAASFAAITSSQWVTSGTDISYSNGNVGIGTSSPQNLLHLSYSGAMGYFKADNYSNVSAGFDVGGRKARGTSETPLAVVSGDRLASLYGAGYNGSDFSAYVGAVHIKADGSFAVSSTPTSITFETAASGTTNRTQKMVIKNDGNVGIGTNNPTQKLEVNGDIKANNLNHHIISRTVPTTIDDYIEIGVWSLSSGSHSLDVSITVNSAGFSLAKRYFIAANWNATSGSWRTVLPIVEGGPYSGNDIVLEARVNSGELTLRLKRVLGSTGGTASISIQQRGHMNATFNELMGTGSDPTVYSAFPNSNIVQTSTKTGVGVSAPATTFHVRHSDSGQLPLNVSGLFVENSGSANASFVFQTASTGGGKSFNVTNAGNVGIGTTTPEARLQIAAGTSSNAPLKLTSGMLLSLPQSGTIEYDGDNFYLTDGTNTRRSIATTQSQGSFDNTNTISNDSGNITLAPNSTAGSVIVSSTTASADANTGALVVRGGAGIAGNLNVSGSILTSGNIQGASITATSGIATPVIQGVPSLTLNPVDSPVGIGILNPSSDLHIAKQDKSINLAIENLSSNSLRYPGLSVINYMGSAGGHPYMSQSNFGGASGTPLATPGSRVIMSLIGHGHDGMNSHQVSRLQFISEATYTTSSTPTSIVFYPGRQTTAGYFEAMRLNSKGYLGLGTGTVNLLEKFVVDTSDGGLTQQFISTKSVSNPAIGTLGSGLTFGWGGPTSGPSIRTFHGGDYNQAGLGFSTWDGASESEKFRISPTGHVQIYSPKTATDNNIRFTTGYSNANLISIDNLSGDVLLDHIVGARFQASASTTVNRLVTLKIDNAPTVSGALTASSPLALWVEAGNTSFGGNVGLGTTTATSMTAKLNILGSSTGEVAQYIQNTNTNGYAVLRLNNFYGANASGTALHSFGPGYGTSGTAYAPLTTTLSGFDSGGLILHAHSGDINFFSGGSSSANRRMIITESGYVGLGTANPEMNLDLRSSADSSLYLNIQHDRNHVGATNPKVGVRLENNSEASGGPNQAALIYLDSYQNNNAGHLYISNRSANKKVILQATTVGSVVKDAIIIDSTGMVGIATSSPTQALDVVGNIQTSGCLYYASSSLGTCASDARLKKDIIGFDLGLEALLKINPVKFKYNGLAGFKNDGKEQLGVIAQDVEHAAPELVKKQLVQLNASDKDKTEIKVVDYGAFTYVIINAIKDLYKYMIQQSRQVASLAESKADKAEIEKLKLAYELQKQENLKLQKRLEHLEKIIDSKK